MSLDRWIGLALSVILAVGLLIMAKISIESLRKKMWLQLLLAIMVTAVVVLLLAVTVPYYIPAH